MPQFKTEGALAEVGWPSTAAPPTFGPRELYTAPEGIYRLASSDPVNNPDDRIVRFGNLCIVLHGGSKQRPEKFDCLAWASHSVFVLTDERKLTVSFG